MFGLGLGLNEIIIVLLVLLLLFGGRKLPEFMKGVSEAIKEFRKAAKGND